MRAVGRDVDVLVDVGAAKVERIEAAPAIDDIAPVARVPDEDVVAGAELCHVVAAAADHYVIAGAADQHVCALAAGDDVIAGAAIDRQLSQSGRKRRSIDRVVAAAAIDQKVIDAD